MGRAGQRMTRKLEQQWRAVWIYWTIACAHERSRPRLVTSVSVSAALPRGHVSLSLSGECVRGGAASSWATAMAPCPATPRRNN
jgi:hypothetical protein